jgi:hypothetical protein
MPSRCAANSRRPSAEAPTPGETTLAASTRSVSAASLRDWYDFAPSAAVQARTVCATVAAVMSHGGPSRQALTGRNTSATCIAGDPASRQS